MAVFSVPRQFGDPVRARVVPERAAGSWRPGVRGPSAEAFRAAASDPSHGLDPAVRDQLARAFAGDFSLVRVHSGEASRAAAASVGARAYTLGRDIYLGAEAASLSGRDRAALLAHEAAHSAQQGMRTVPPSVGLPVSRPSDPAEQEAERIGQAVTAPGRAGEQRPSYPQARIAASVSPRIQRDFPDEIKVTNGVFKIDFEKTFAPVGLTGTIEFAPSKTADDSEDIRLLQVARVEDLRSNRDVDWKYPEKRRNKMRTEAAAGITPGYFVDHLAGKARRRKNTGYEAVSPYYTAHQVWGREHDGWKRGQDDIKPASLEDSPHSTFGIRDDPDPPVRDRFSYETAARDVIDGRYYGSLTWEFTTSSEPDHPFIDNEQARAQDVPSPTFHAAVAKFHEVYRNRGSRTAPENVEQVRHDE